MRNFEQLISLCLDLDKSGLIWCPEIGDEVAERGHFDKVSVFVDPQGLTPSELRNFFIWMPTVEQLVSQFEARQALVYHAGVNKSLSYEAVIKTSIGVIETSAPNLRLAFGKALHEILNNSQSEMIH
jgi:hypothetical protein